MEQPELVRVVLLLEPEQAEILKQQMGKGSAIARRALAAQGVGFERVRLVGKPPRARSGK